MFRIFQNILVGLLIIIVLLLSLNIFRRAKETHDGAFKLLVVPFFFLLIPLYRLCQRETRPSR